jgi:hypothetical protein
MTESRCVAALVGLVALGIGALAASGPLEALVKLVPDDGFYYLELARRIGAGEGSTFDGIHETNGYHPLWLLLLVPLAPLMEHSRLDGVRVSLLLGGAALVGTAALVHQTAARLAPGYAALAPLWLAATLMVASIYGMEAPLAALLAASLWYAVSRGYPRGLGGGLGMGVLGAALFLARLDAVLIVAAVNLVWAWFVLQREAELRPFLAAVLVQGLVGAGYLALNQWLFDAWMPISATIKASRQGGTSLRWLSSLMAWLGLGSAGLAALVLFVTRGALPWSIALGTLACMLSIAVGGGRETYNWYFTLPVLGGALLLPIGVALLRPQLLRRPALRHVPVRALVWVMALGLLAVAVRGKTRPTGFQEKIERAQWLAEHAPEGAVFAEGDCGILGYISRRPFVNLDGLTNGPDFLQAVDDGTLGAWLQQSGVNAMALPTGKAEGKLVARGRGYGQKVPLVPVLVPWEPPVQDARYTLWRIEAFGR